MSGYDEPGWKLQLDKCPCDYDFLDWFKDHREGNKPVFHMGPGLHNIVGKQLMKWGIDSYSVTISKEEVEANPSYVGSLFRASYTTLLCDIALMHNWIAWPKFKVMTLFHLGEYPGTFAEVTELVFNRIIDAVEPGGLIFFYPGSSAWDRIEPLVKNSPRLFPKGGHKSVIYYEKFS